MGRTREGEEEGEWEEEEENQEEKEEEKEEDEDEDGGKIHVMNALFCTIHRTCKKNYTDRIKLYFFYLMFDNAMY